MGGQLAGVCSDDGTTTILRLGDGLSAIQPNEKTTLSQLFDKEARREKNLDAAAREREAKARKPQASAQTQTTPGAQPPSPAPIQARASSTAEVEALLSQVEKEFLSAVQVQENGKRS